MEITDITIVDVKPQLVLGVRRRGPYRQIPELLKKLFEFAMGKNIKIEGPPLFVCHETAEEAMEADKNNNADVEVAIPIAEKVDGTDGIRCYELCGGKMAKTVHKGPYEECGPAYERLFARIRDKGLRITGPTREVYLNDPREVPKEEILTEIYAPVG